MNNQKDIKYINRDFNSFKEALINYAKSYFPETYNDFNDADPGNMYIEMASYVGDVLSFYQDKQMQEVLLEYAQQKDNLISMAYSLGYRPKVTSTSIVNLEVFQLLPANIVSGIASPDFSYSLIVDKEAKINSISNPGVTFVTQDLVDFSFSSSADPTTISVYSLNSGTNQPDYYLLQKNIKAYAGTIKSQDFTFSSAVKFDSITLSDSNIIEILDVVDSDGNKWYEVPYLAQSTIFEQIKNTELNDPTLSQFNNVVPYLLKLRKVQRRFVSRFKGDNTLDLEFGSGIVSNPDEEIVPNSDNIGQGLINSLSKLTTAFDPSNFLYTKEYGLAPSNTTLTVRYIVGGGVETNVPSGDIKNIYEITISPVSINPNPLNGPLLQFIKKSVSFDNDTPSAGGGDGDSNQDLRLKTMSNFPTQLRNVTEEDHIVRAMSMPGKFGTVAKAYVAQDDLLLPYDKNNDFVSSNPLALSLYVLSFDANRNLVTGSLALKENLKNYVSQYKICNDGITIKDAYPINIGCDFDIIVLPSFNSREVLSNCFQAVKDYFNIDNWQINQPIMLSEIYNLIGRIKGVQSVNKVTITNKQGISNGYSRWGYDIAGATRKQIIYPSQDPSIWEVKFPDQDINGRTINY